MGLKKKSSRLTSIRWGYTRGSAAKPVASDDETGMTQMSQAS